VVVTGTVKSVSDGAICRVAGYDGRWRIAEFKPDHLIRGEVHTLISVRLYSHIANDRLIMNDNPKRMDERNAVHVGKRYLLFLRKVTEGIFERADYRGQVLELPPSSGHALDEKDGIGLSEIDQVKRELLTAIQTQNITIAPAAIHGVVELDAPTMEAMEAIETASHSKEPELAAPAIYARFYFGVDGAPDQLVEMLRGNKCPTEELMPLLIEMYRPHTQHPQAKTLAMLAALMGCREQAVRQVATLALGKTQDEKVYPLLIAALDDSNDLVRSHALNALAGIQHVPEWSKQRNDEETKASIAHWKSWWESEGKARYSTGEKPVK